MLDDPALKELVVSSLARGQSRNMVVTQLCEQTGAAWPEVETFVRSIETSEDQRIARRRTPTLLLILVPTLIAGLSMSAYASYVLYLDTRFYEQEFSGALPIGLLALASLHWQTLSDNPHGNGHDCRKRNRPRANPRDTRHSLATISFTPIAARSNTRVNSPVLLVPLPIRKFASMPSRGMAQVLAAALGEQVFRCAAGRNSARIGVCRGRLRHALRVARGIRWL